MTWLRVNRVMVSVWISLAPVWRITSSRAAEMTAPESPTDFRRRRGRADFVSRPDAVRTESFPKWVMAAATADFASYTAVVVTRSWAMSDWSWRSVAPYSALSKPPKRALPSSTVISELRRSPWEIRWWWGKPNDAEHSPIASARNRTELSVR